MGYTLPTTRKVKVEIEVPEGVNLEELLKGVKYRIIDRSRERKKVLEKYTGILGKAKSEELDEIAEEAWKT